MMNYNAQYDIINCLMTHEYKVKYDNRGVPTKCRACEPSKTHTQPKDKVREFRSLVKS